MGKIQDKSFFFIFRLNLENGAIEFLANCKSVTLYSAYLKIDELKKINSKKNITQIIVRWEIRDLCLGVSDLELFQYCIDNNIALYRNTRIHLKTLWNNEKSVFFGSANVTNKGLGEMGNYNYELNGAQGQISFEDILYFNTIINSSENVNETLYKKIKKIVDETILPVIDYPILETKKENIDFFLLSQLPMTYDPDSLYEMEVDGNTSDVDISCAAHDLALYKVSRKMTKKEFNDKLKNEFNSHPFITKFKAAIMNATHNDSNRDGSLQFGAVRNWFAQNTTTVPTPRPFELTDNVQILYKWICYFDTNFTQSIPGAHSQVIKYNRKD